MSYIANPYEAYHSLFDHRYQEVEGILAEAGKSTASRNVRKYLWRLGSWKYGGTKPQKPLDTLDDLRRELGLIPSPTLRGLQGPLRLTSTGIKDDHGYVIPRVRHAGDLFALWVRDPVWATQEAKSIKAAGAHGVRTWTILGGEYWTSKDRHVDPRKGWHSVSTFSRMLRDVGLRWMVSNGDLTRLLPPNQWPDFMTELAERIECEIISVDAGNEAYTQSTGTKADMEKALEAFLLTRSVDISSLTDSPEDDLSKWDGQHATVTDVHSYRGGHAHDKLRHIFSHHWENEPPHRIISQSEGPGAYSPGSLVSVTQNHRELDAEYMGMQAAMQALFRGIPVQFDSPGVSVRTKGEFAQMPGHDTVWKVVDKLPQDIHTWKITGHGGTSQKGKRVFVAGTEERSMRCDHVFADDGFTDRRVVVACYGPAGEWPTRCERAVKGRWLYPVDATLSTDVAYQSGDSFPVTFNRGRIFIGEFV